ncbi:IS200/IS605 family transposase [Anaerorhabdus sp.]|uniref:IS200/IS605 family transposase n=1 Tax=Anaerorhabdus sp. TaxID=1872524 RepID=UPI003FA523B7
MVIVPKYRRMVIYNRLRQDVINILKSLITRKPDIELIEGEACPDYIHMLIEIAPKYAVSDFMGYLKSKSTLMIFDRHANMKYKYGNRKFWARGYFVDTVGKNEKVIREYIQNQLAEDKLNDQISMKEFIDPFTGEEVKGKQQKENPFKG